MASEARDRLDQARYRWRLRYEGAEAAMAALAIERADQIVSARLNELLKPLDLNVVRYEILALLAFADDQRLPLGRMSEWLAVTATSVTNNLDRLEANGYVRRRPHPTDRRTTLAELTHSGDEVFDQASKLLVGEDFGLGPLSREEMVLLTRLLAKLPERG